MKKLFNSAIAIVLALSALPAAASLLIHEDFNYAAGSIIGQTVNAPGLNGGATWSKAAGSGAAFVVQAASVSFAGHFADAGGSLLLSNPSGPYADDSAAAAVTGTLTGYPTLFASSIMSLSTSGQYYNDWIIEQRFNSSATGIWSSSSGRNLVSAFGSGGSSARKGGVSANQNEVAQGTGTLAAGTPYLLVTAYTISGTDVSSATLYTFDQTTYGNYLANSTAGNAEVNLSIYALFSLTDSETAALANFSFLQFAINGGPSGQVDNFRLGTAITDVVNVAPVPEPSVLALIGLGGLALSLVRRRA